MIDDLIQHKFTNTSYVRIPGSGRQKEARFSSYCSLPGYTGLCSMCIVGISSLSLRSPHKHILLHFIGRVLNHFLRNLKESHLRCGSYSWLFLGHL